MLITVENPNLLYSENVSDALEKVVSKALGQRWWGVEFLDPILEYYYVESSNFRRLEPDAKFSYSIDRFCEELGWEFDSDFTFMASEWEDTMMAFCGSSYDEKWQRIFASCVTTKPDLVILLHHKDFTDTQEFSEKRRALEERHAIFKSRAQMKGRPPTLEYHEDCFCKGVASTFKLTPEFIDAVTSAIKEHVVSAPKT